MSTSHPLNQAVIAQALYDLRNGQLRRCKAMGFGEAELDALKHPALISVLANASVSWCSVTVNREVLQRLLNQAQDVEGNRHGRSHAAAGASTEMVSRFYGLTHQEVALRREILGLPKRKGRHPVLDETQDTELWRQWKAVTSSRNVDLEDETSILDAAMDLAEGMSLPLSVVWAAIRNWVDQGIGLAMAVDDTAHEPASRPVALADLFDAALKDLTPATSQRASAHGSAHACRVRRRLPVQWQSARERAAAAVPRPPPDTAGAQRLAGVPADAQRRRRHGVPDL